MFSRFHVSFGADAEAHKVVQQGLKSFNIQQIGAYGYDAIELYVRDAAGEVVGGLFGHSGMGWLYVDYLWLHEDLRGMRLGEHLMRLVEQEAQRRGCVGVFLYTYDFQAPDFYHKQGYQLMGVLEDCPPGYQRLYLKKRLSPEAQ